MDRALGFFENERVGALNEDRDGSTGVFDSSDFDDTRASGLSLFNELSETKLVFGERVNISNGFASSGLFLWLLLG